MILAKAFFMLSILHLIALAVESQDEARKKGWWQFWK
jgi:hypothetical protein